MKKRTFGESGISLIEVLVVIGLVSILTSLAVPAFRSMLVNRTAQAAADTLVADIRFARSEAVKRSARVVVCRSDTGTGCVDGDSWNAGWIVFVDLDQNDVVDGNDVIMRVQQTVPGISTIQGNSNPSNTRRVFRYEPAGFAKAADQTFNITPAGSDGASYMRLVCVSLTGRAAIRAKGQTSC